MLWFLSIAAKRQLRVDDYRDQAVAGIARNIQGKAYIARIVLRPRESFCNTRKMPTAAEIDLLHELTDAECTIAHSVRADVVPASPCIERAGCSGDSQASRRFELGVQTRAFLPKALLSLACASLCAHWSQDAPRQGRRARQSASLRSAHPTQARSSDALRLHPTDAPAPARGAIQPGVPLAAPPARAARSAAANARAR